MDRVNTLILQRIPAEAMSSFIFPGLERQEGKDSEHRTLTLNLPIDPALSSRMRNEILKTFPAPKAVNKIKNELQLRNFQFTEGVEINNSDQNFIEIKAVTKVINLILYLKGDASVSLYCEIKTAQNLKESISEIEDISSDEWEKFLLDIREALSE